MIHTISRERRQPRSASIRQPPRVAVAYVGERSRCQQAGRSIRSGSVRQPIHLHLRLELVCVYHLTWMRGRERMSDGTDHDPLAVARAAFEAMGAHDWPGLRRWVDPAALVTLKHQAVSVAAAAA